MGMIVVTISDLKLAAAPDVLVTYALGSCVGICLYDPAIRLAGLSHILLPSSRLAPGDSNTCKFADTAIPELVKRMELRGALRTRLRAKLAGGAQMFDIPAGNENNGNSVWLIGHRNVDAAVEVLGRMNIPIVARDVLKNYGRTVTFDPADGMMTVQGKGSKITL